MEIKDLIEKLDQEMTRVYEYYCKEHQELTKYANRMLDTQEEVDKANEVLGNIQNAFKELAPGFHYIITRYEQANNASQQYQGFINDLRKAGLQFKEEEHKPEEAH